MKSLKTDIICHFSLSNVIARPDPINCSHSNELSFDHEALVHGVRILEAIVEARLGKKYS